MKCFKTGQWWINTWWEKNELYDYFHLTLEETKSIIKHIRKIFDDKWFRKYYKKYNSKPSHNNKIHPVIFFLKGEGTHFFSYIVEIGRPLLVLSNYQHLMGNIPTRLKNPDQYNGAKFELLLLAHFLSGGFKVQRDCKSNSGNKNCDFCISDTKNNHIYFELKSLRISPRNSERKKFNISLLFKINPGTNCRFDFDFLPDFQKKSLTKEGHLEIIKDQDNILNKINNDMSNNAQKGHWGQHTIPGIAQYTLYPLAPEEPKSNNIKQLQLNPKIELEKIINNAIVDAHEQLQAPGVLLIDNIMRYSKETCLLLAKHLLDDGKKYTNISLICFINMQLGSYQDGNPRYFLQLLPNPHAKDVMKTEIIQHFSKITKSVKQN